MVVWLASYPKSGNTWVRALYSAYGLSANGPRPVDINDLGGGPIASSREMFDRLIGLPSTDLTHAQIAALRPDVYRARAAAAGRTVLIKAHDAFGTTPDGGALFPPDVTQGVMYVIRHPAAVAVSLASHSGISVGEAVGRLCDSHHGLAHSAGRFHEQLPQHVGTWSDHAASWIDRSGGRIEIVRYEDLHADPADALRRLLSLMGETVNAHQVAAAVQASRFDVLQASEREQGFKERPNQASDLFFRQGRVDGWRELITSQDLTRLVDAHGKMMRRFGYDTRS